VVAMNGVVLIVINFVNLIKHHHQHDQQHQGFVRAECETTENEEHCQKKARRNGTITCLYFAP